MPGKKLAGAIQFNSVFVLTGRIAGLLFESEAELRIADTEVAGELLQVRAGVHMFQHGGPGEEDKLLFRSRHGIRLVHAWPDKG